MQNYGSVKGSCKEVTLAAAYEAARVGISTCICSGTYNGQDHHWLRHDHMLYDATVAQFTGNEEIEVLEEVKASLYLEDSFIFVNSGLVAPLLSS